jgi:hypothetical protein
VKYLSDHGAAMQKTRRRLGEAADFRLPNIVGAAGRY